jgi:predicted Zn-dependent protease
MFRMTRRGILVVLLISLSSIVGCSTTSEKEVLTEEEVTRREANINSELVVRFESQIKFQEDKDVAVYLRKIAETLTQASPELVSSPVGVWLIQSRTKKWESYSLPGNRIYLSGAILKKFEYENEVAALLALQLGHLVHHQVLKKLDELLEPKKDIQSPIDPTHKFKKKELKVLSSPRGQEFVRMAQYFGPNGVFAYNEDEHLEAIQGAVEVLYTAGYDARGLISLFELFRKNLKYSPYDSDTLDKMIERARYEVAQFAPLRNPIVRTQSFTSIQKRFQRL